MHKIMYVWLSQGLVGPKGVKGPPVSTPQKYMFVQTVKEKIISTLHQFTNSKSVSNDLLVVQGDPGRSTAGPKGEIVRHYSSVCLLFILCLPIAYFFF